MRTKKPHDTPRDTSWNSVSNWYHSIVGSKGSYYHQHVVLPGVLRLLDLRVTDSLLDLGCGQGILSRVIPKVSSYLGIDAAGGLISQARKLSTPTTTFLQADVTKPLPQLNDDSFSHAACILALQNMEHPERMFATVARVLKPGGVFVVALNHPCFRIPRQSGWGIDESKKMQYRKVERYFSPLKIPITAHPGEKRSAVTWSFHWPLQDIIQFGLAQGLKVTGVEEWVSDKESEGRTAKMENRSRSEFPLFLALRFQK